MSKSRKKVVKALSVENQTFLSAQNLKQYKVAEMFDMSAAVFANSSAKNRYVNALRAFHKHQNKNLTTQQKKFLKDLKEGKENIYYSFEDDKELQARKELKKCRYYGQCDCATACVSVDDF